MHYRSATMFNMELSIEVLKLFIIKLSIVVDDDGPRKAESTDDGLPYKLSDLSHRLGFHPFDKVVNGYE